MLRCVLNVVMRLLVLLPVWVVEVWQERRRSRAVSCSADLFPVTLPLRSATVRYVTLSHMGKVLVN